MRKLLFTTAVLLFSSFVIQAQKTEDNKNEKQTNEKIYIKLKDDAKPDIYIDGKKFDFPMELIDQSMIASISVIKNEQAIKRFNAPNGVILIETKIMKDIEVSEINVSDNNIFTSKNTPKVIINGKVSNNKMLKLLEPDQIKSIDVLKGEKAIQKHNAPNGVIIITTKTKQ
ncbi:hypothetical protein [uncultured Polaribacter sp.]|uniref:hypothetical protein n=1 Tax=uncultured Polaribacter sp. TaxID=174711 RepID=UPI002615BE9D|nr:hypothetical protein [uncultured Polaribacter sp.]